MVLKHYQTAMEKFHKLSKAELDAIKQVLFFVIIADLFGIYWYFDLKKLGVAILLVCIGILVMILIELRKFTQEEVEKWKFNKKKHKNKKEYKEFDYDYNKKQEENDFGFGSVLGSSEDYNKRLEKALGSGF